MRNKADIFKDMKKGMVNHLKFMMESDMKSIEEYEEDIKRYRRELDTIPKWIMDKRGKIKTLLDKIKDAKISSSIIKDMELK